MCCEFIRLLFARACVKRAIPGHERAVFGPSCRARAFTREDVPAGTMAVVRSPDFLRALNQRALATLIHQRRLTPSCGGHAPTAERTVGPARMIAESLTLKPGIREHNPLQSGHGQVAVAFDGREWLLYTDCCRQ